jgi:hypothetical protein
MSNKPWASKLARKLQRVAEDELGKRPSLMACHRIVADDLNGVRRPGEEGVKAEEFAVRLFLLRRDLLLASAEQKVVNDLERKNDAVREKDPVPL